MIHGKERAFLSAKRVDLVEEVKLRYLVELLNFIPGTALMPDNQITLTAVLVVMLLRNVQPSNGQMDVARYMLVSMMNKAMCIRAVNETDSKKRLIITRILCDLEMKVLLFQVSLKLRFRHMTALQSQLRRRKDSHTMEQLKLISATNAL